MSTASGGWRTHGALESFIGWDQASAMEVFLHYTIVLLVFPSFCEKG